MPYTARILHKITQLTEKREEEALVDAFFDLMLAEFELIKGIALYKMEQMAEESMLSLQNSRIAAKDETDIFSTETMLQPLSELLQKFLQDNMTPEDCYQTIDGHSLLIKKSNRDKTAMYFLVYWLSDTDECEFQSGFIPSALLKNQNNNPQLLSIHSLSEIYTNHQSMISLNDKDSLTGLFNRKSFDRSMHRCYRLMNHDLRRAHEAENTACLAILDIDHFKKVNDTYGHLYGDEVLLHFAQQMQKIFRQDDGLFRYGGEEFIVILNDVDIDIAESVLNRFRKHIKAYPFPKVDKLTVSIGYTRLETGRMQSEIVDRADHALYFAKEHGRNNVACYEKLVDEGLLQELVTEDDIELF